MTSREKLIHALEDAGTRGLSRKELIDVVGTWYDRRLRELELDGAVLCRKRGRYRSSTWWRVSMVLPPRPQPVDLEEVVVERLFEPPASPAREALFEDVAA